MSNTTQKMSLGVRCKYAAETAATYTMYGFFRILPLEVASNLGGWLLSCIGPMTKFSRTARINLNLAFPEKSEEEKKKILSGMWDNLGRIVAEYPHLHRIWPNVELVGQENIVTLRDSRKAAVIFAAHIANWEIPAISTKQNGLDIHLVYRKPNNPWINSLLWRARSVGSCDPIEKGSAGARKIVSLLRSDKVVGMLIDQKLNEGVPIPLFGHEAMTAPAIAHFALKFKCPLYPLRVERLSGSRFRVTAFPPMEVLDTGHKDEDVKRILTDINQLLEKWIQELPEQWLWIHRRWPKSLYAKSV